MRKLEKIKVARDLPPPPVLTEKDLKRIHLEAKESQKSMMKATRSLRMTPKDVKKATNIRNTT